MSPNVIIAAFLFLLSSIGLYVIWYIVRGRRKKLEREALASAPDKGTEAAAEEAPEKKMPSRPYSYPKINDVMGYDFVTVVDVPVELLSDNKPAKLKFEDAPAIGLTAVSNEAAVNEEDEIHDTTQPRDYAESEEAEAGGYADGEERDVVEDGDIAMEDIDAINSMNINWDSRDEEDGTDDETLNAIMDHNAGMIEEAELNEENTRVARIVEIERRMAQMTENVIDVEDKGDSGFGDEMMGSEPDETDGQDGAETTDEGGEGADSAPLAPDEIPDI